MRFPQLIATSAISIALGFMAIVPQPVSGAAIIIRTGVDAALNPLGENVTDPFWTISVQGGAFTSAEVVNSEVICCGMETAGAQARWISDPSVTDGSIATGWGIGPTAIARRSFDLTGFDLGTTTLLGAWRVADFRQGVFINGVLINPATADNGSAWFLDQPIASAGLFVDGINVLELRGASGNSTWDAFWLDVTIQDAAVVPEPITLALLGLGLFGLFFAQPRRRRSAI